MIRICLVGAMLVQGAGSRAQSVTMTVGPNVNISKSFGDNAEETIAINPKNPANLFASETYLLVTRFSLDGGLTWSNRDVSALGSSDGDVSAAWDDFGNLFLVRLSSGLYQVVVGVSTNGGTTFRLLYKSNLPDR